MRRWLLPVLVTAALVGVPAPAEAQWAERLLRGSIIAMQGLFITEKDEIALGQQTTAQILTQMPELQDAGIKAYVNQIGQRVARFSERKNIPYHFYVVNDKAVNAFAAPGGFVFVTTGALRFMSNEAQLAGVLGHEVAHVARRHSVQAIRKAMIAQGLATAVLDSQSGELTRIAASIGAGLILKGFDRKAELESDRLGAAYSLAAGYDPRQLTAFLGGLARANGEPPRWLQPVSNHPRGDDRIKQLNTLIGNGQLKLRKGLVLNQANYARRVSRVLATIPVPATPAKAQ